MKKLNKILLPLLLICLFFALNACDKKAYNTNVPYGSLGDTTYASVGELKLSEKQLYERMRSNAYNSFMDSIIKTIVKPSDFNLSITTNHDELVELINEDCYGTKEIDEIRTATKRESEKKYVDTMALLGVKISENDIYNDANLTYYLDELAEKYFARKQITDSSSKYYCANEYEMENNEFVLEDKNKVKNPYYITEEKIEDTFNSLANEDNTYSAIIVGYKTLDDANKALEAVSSIADTEQKFTKLFENAYSYKDTATAFELTDDDLSGYDSALVTLIKSMKAGEYTKLPQKFNKITYLVYLKAEKNESKVKFADLTDTQKSEAIDEIIDDYLTTSFIDSMIKETIEKSEIKIFDPVLDAQFKVAYTDHKLLAKGDKAWSNDVVAVVNGKNITVNELYTKLEKTLGVTVAMDYFINKILLDSDYADKITKDDLEKIKSDYNSVMDSFKKGSYKENGYPTSLGEEVFKFLFFGSTDYDTIINYYKSQKAWDYAIKDYPEQYFDVLEKFSKQYYETYYSLSVKHILVTVDYDMDGTPDDPELFANKLTAAQNDSVNAAILALMNAVCKEANYIVEQEYASLSEALDYILLQFYANGELLSDTSKTWNDYSKEFNLGLTIEDLEEVNSNNASTYVKEFGVGVKELYNKLIDEELITSDGKLTDDYLVQSVAMEDLIATTYGYHVLAAYDTKTLTSAQYTEENDSTDSYEDIVVTWKGNEETVPNAYSNEKWASKNQIKIYVCESATDDGIEHLPTNVETYIKYFISSFEKRFSDSTFQNILLADRFLNDINFADTDNKAEYNSFIEIQKRQFDEYEDYSATSNQVFSGWWEELLNAYNPNKAE